MATKKNNFKLVDKDGNEKTLDPQNAAAPEEE